MTAGPGDDRRFEGVLELQGVGDLLAFVEARCGALLGDVSACFDAKLAVEEVCVNLLQHGYSGGAGFVSVGIERRGSELIIEVHDRAPAFAPDGGSAPDIGAALEDRPVGGLGLFLVREVMDEVRYASEQGGNRLTMVKRIEPDDN